ncbi:hypothetical protein GCM10008018_28830 [Paenibacillus marchantiophytorum]|uniref:Uncharacterized protein n=1 Tax=Paenibacillus marchantiophytorum TaxID=1619310 RepID=A0ABQ1EQ68_9BACL|nr:hypothetical protein GCM10008018_28830 [Paenibacillus marchantiophytorum]
MVLALKSGLLEGIRVFGDCYLRGKWMFSRIRSLWRLLSVVLALKSGQFEGKKPPIP